MADNLSSECPRAGRWWRGCKFEARYDREAPAFDDPFYMTYLVGEAAKVAAGGKSKATYVRDVCVRCGRTIERG